MPLYYDGGVGKVEAQRRGGVAIRSAQLACRCLPAAARVCVLERERESGRVHVRHRFCTCARERT